MKKVRFLAFRVDIRFRYQPGFFYLLCDTRRNVSTRSVTIDGVRLLKDQIKTMLDKSKLAREESGASAADCSARRMLDGVSNVLRKIPFREWC